MLPAPRKPFNYDDVPADQAVALRKQAAHICERVQSTTTAIVEIGGDLLAVKQALEHHQFLPWVEAECGFGVRSAENYMRAAEFAEGKFATVANLPPGAIYKLSAKSAPTEVVKEVIDRIEKGERVAKTDIDNALWQARREASEASRRKQRPPLSKRTEARNARRRAEELKRMKEVSERHRVAALSIIDTIGGDHTRFLLEVLSPTDQWEVLEHLRREVHNIERDENHRTPQAHRSQKPAAAPAKPDGKLECTYCGHRYLNPCTTTERRDGCGNYQPRPHTVIFELPVQL